VDLNNTLHAMYIKRINLE